MTTNWRAEAVCRGADISIFFPPADVTIRYYDKAKEYCDRCPVIDQCLQDALHEEGDHGYRANTTPKKRRKLRRELGIQLQTPGVTVLTDYFNGPRHPGCGTHAGWVRHYRNGTPPCDDCVAARLGYQADWRPKKAARRRAQVAS